MQNRNLIYLIDASNNVVCCLNGVQYDSVSYSENLMEYDTLSFVVDEYIDINGERVRSDGYDSLHERMYVYLSGLHIRDNIKKGLFCITSEPSVSNDGYNESKTVTCDSTECELNNQSFAVKVNTGEVDSAEYLADGNVDPATGLAKEYITVHNDDNPSLSLLCLALEEVPYWSVGYVDPLVKDKKFTFDGDPKPIYSFLLNDLAPLAQVVFLFDTVDRKVNVYSIERMDEIGETNIFVGYHNLLDTVDISPSNDGIYTRFNVEGADGLSIESVNFNEPRVENLLNLLNTVDENGNSTYVSKDTVDKYKIWYDYRYGENGRRQEFIELSKSYNGYIISISELQNRLPPDALDYTQYEGMDEETLNSLLEQYIIIVNGLVVDYAKKDSDGNVVVDSDGLAIIDDMDGLMDSIYWQDYCIYVDSIIPNIQIAIQNLSLPEEDRLDYDDSYETDWNLYGSTELTNKLNSYKANVDVLSDSGYEKDWGDLTEEEQSKWTQGSYELYHTQYVRYKNQYDVCYIALHGSDDIATKLYQDADGYYLQRTDGTQYYFDSEWVQTEISPLRSGNELNGRLEEIESAEAAQEAVKTEINALVEDVSKSNPRFGFTQDELSALSRLTKDSDYVNENILTTSLDDVVTQIKQSEELFQAAVDQLDIESQPQYSFSATMDNLFNIEAFAAWRGDFLCGNFIRVGLEDDKHIKLRVLSITFNPCVSDDNELTITFSNMLRGKSGLSDYMNLFNSALTSSINQITANYAKNVDVAALYINEDVLRAIVNSGTFNSSVNGIVSDNLTASDGTFNTITSKYISTDEFEARLARIQTLEADSAFIKYLEANLIVAGEIDTEKLKASLAQIDVLEVGDTFTETLTALISTTSKSTIDDAYIQSAVINKVYVGDLAGDTISTNKFTISSDDGAILIQDSTQYWYDENGNIRMQAGLDATGNFTFSIFDETGTGVLIDSTGVKEKAVADGLVEERMLSVDSVSTGKIQDSAITSEKIDWSSFSAYVNEHGSEVIDISEFIVDEGGLSYKLGSLVTKVDELEKQSTVTIEIEASSLLYDGSEIQLTGHVYNNDKEVTDQVPAERFTWKQMSASSTDDDEWNNLHVGMKSVVITTITDTTSYELRVDTSELTFVSE